MVFTLAFVAFAQVDPNARSDKDNRNTAPTVGTGGTMGGPTGLFTVYDQETLRKGEFTFSAAVSNYDRDPGNVDITELPVSFQIGVTNNIELFFNTDAYRAVKVNSPRNLSGFYLPNSQLSNGLSAPAIVLGPYNGNFPGQAVYRATGEQPFTQYPFGGGSGSSFPGVGSIYGSILPGVVLQTALVNNVEVPTSYSLAPSYLPDAPFINRTYGESSFSTFTVGTKIRFNNVNDPIGFGVVGYYRFYADHGDDFSGFNQLQRGASPGGDRGDFGGAFFVGGRLTKWMNLSGNVAYHYNSDVKSGGATLLDRPDELMASVGVDFPANKYIQPIAEFRYMKYVGGRTQNVFENDPMDVILGTRIYPTRWLGFGLAYRYNVNQQDRGAYKDFDDISGADIIIPCTDVVVGQSGTGCEPTIYRTSYSGLPAGFVPSSDPHGYIFQAFIGRRNKRQAEVENQFANVDSVTLSKTTVTIPCEPGFRPKEGETCDDDQTISVATAASDPENDVLTYNYTVSGGRIVGSGANVSWDLSGVEPGSYTITTGVDDGCGLCGRTDTKTVEVVKCDCVQECECASISVTGPAGITPPGQTMTFTASVSGGTADDVTYNWSVSSGTIVSGQGTPSIVVSTTEDMADSTVTATVDVGGQAASCNCPTTSSDTGVVGTKPEPTQIDEFGKLPNDEVRGRIDNLFVTLSNNPDAQGYIINYGTDREIAAREKLIQNHINFRKYDRSRVTMVRGGNPDGVQNTKVYTVPPGAEDPMP
jgi:hypothetical protein